MTEELKKKKEAIWKSVKVSGRSEGSVIATQEELRWFLEQGVCDGILITFRAAPETWQQGDECYYYYYAITLKADKEMLRIFADTYQLPSVKALNKLMPPAGTTNPDELRVAENIKQVRRLKQARDRRRRKRERQEEEEQWIADYNAAKQAYERYEAERDECYEHRNDLNWLVARIEQMGWEVTLRRKPDDTATSRA